MRTELEELAAAEGTCWKSEKDGEAPSKSGPWSHPARLGASWKMKWTNLLKIQGKVFGCSCSQKA